MKRPSASATTAAPLAQAFDEARFGASRTLDLRTSMPTAAEAVQRLEPWLRQKQVEKAGELLVITGRGNGSPGGVGVVREAVRKALTQLKRKRVVASVVEHTSGSYVVTLERTAALFEAGRRTRDHERAPKVPRHEIPGLQAVEVPNRGHTPNLDEPVAISAIDRFLANLPHRNGPFTSIARTLSGVAFVTKLALKGAGGSASRFRTRAASRKAAATA